MAVVSSVNALLGLFQEGYVDDCGAGVLSIGETYRGLADDLEVESADQAVLEDLWELYAEGRPDGGEVRFWGLLRPMGSNAAVFWKGRLLGEVSAAVLESEGSLEDGVAAVFMAAYHREGGFGLRLYLALP